MEWQWWSPDDLLGEYIVCPNRASGSVQLADNTQTKWYACISDHRLHDCVLIGPFHASRPARGNTDQNKRQTLRAIRTSFGLLEEAQRTCQLSASRKGRAPKQYWDPSPDSLDWTAILLPWQPLFAWRAWLKWHWLRASQFSANDSAL